MHAIIHGAHEEIRGLLVGVGSLSTGIVASVCLLFLRHVGPKSPNFYKITDYLSECALV